MRSTGNIVDWYWITCRTCGMTHVAGPWSHRILQEKSFNSKLPGNGSYCTNASLLPIKNMPCSKLHCQKVLFNSLFTQNSPAAYHQASWEAQINCFRFRKTLGRESNSSKKVDTKCATHYNRCRTHIYDSQGRILALAFR